MFSEIISHNVILVLTIAFRLNKFTSEQLVDIAKTKNGQLEDFTWHHHEDEGFFELVDFNTHDKSAHTGGNRLWGNKTGD